METFICKRCKKIKKKDEYAYRNSYKDKLYRSLSCKKCCVEIGSENRRKFRNISPEEYTRQRRESARKYRQNHPEKHYALLRKWRENKRKKIMSLLGELKCKNCGFEDYRALQIDHINGGGNIQRKKLKSSALSIVFLEKEIRLKGKKEYQILCANCNWIKRSENKNERNGKY